MSAPFCADALVDLLWYSYFDRQKAAHRKDPRQFVKSINGVTLAIAATAIGWVTREHHPRDGALHAKYKASVETMTPPQRKDRINPSKGQFNHENARGKFRESCIFQF